jgi:hypothetical protein
MTNEESHLHIRTANYLRTNYPGVPFNSDMSGFRLPIWLAKIAKQLRFQRGWPDMFIPEPRRDCAGLFMELKTSRDEVYTKVGKLRKTQHIQEQNEILEMLRARGFWADFVCGDEQARAVIDWYLGD